MSCCPTLGFQVNLNRGLNYKGNQGSILGSLTPGSGEGGDTLYHGSNGLSGYLFSTKDVSLNAFEVTSADQRLIGETSIARKFIAEGSHLTSKPHKTFLTASSTMY